MVVNTFNCGTEVMARDLYELQTSQGYRVTLSQAAAATTK